MLKKILKKWLGVTNVENVLRYPESDLIYVGSKFDTKVDKKELEKFRKEFNEGLESRLDRDRYKACYECGVVADRYKMTSVAKLNGEIARDNPGVFSRHSLLMAQHFLRGDALARDDNSTTVYCCQHCKKE